MRSQFSLASLLLLVAVSALLFAACRWLGDDVAILAAPFCGAVASACVLPKAPEWTRLRWILGTATAFVALMVVCRLDPRFQFVMDMRLTEGLVICLVESLVATATIEFLIKWNRGDQGPEKGHSSLLTRLELPGSTKSVFE